MSLSKKIVLEKLKERREKSKRKLLELLEEETRRVIWAREF